MIQRWKDVDGPLQSLARAMLTQAVRDIRKNHNRRDAIRWVQSDEDSPFGFNCCCRILSVDPEAARASILDRIETPASRHSLPVAELQELPSDAVLD